MPKKQRLTSQIADVQKQWDLLSKQLYEIEHNRILQTQAEERFRLEHIIEKIKEERKYVEEELEKLESQNRIQNDSGQISSNTDMNNDDLASLGVDDANNNRRFGVENTFAWILKNFQSDIIKSSAEQTKLLWQTFPYKQAAEKYKGKMKGDYNVIQILGMPSPIPLEEIYTEMNILDKPSAFRQSAKELIEKEFKTKILIGNIKGTVDGMQVVRENQRLFIQGKPGAGKTTFLKHLIVEAIQEKELNCLPIFIPLRMLAETKQSLFEFILDEFKICNFPDAKPFVETLLKKGESFELTEKTLDILCKKELPVKVITQLERFKNKEYKTEKEFLNDLGEAIGTARYTPLIV